jgi:hypothetical protein
LRNSKTEKVDAFFITLLKNAIDIIEEHSKDERVIVPMFKTLDFLLEKQEIISWKGI